MSRCFPFPPPGYEKKAIPQDVNLVAKEKKHKEKKHKEKKDKDKKEKRKEKERSEGKHKEDKDRKKKKHRDKKDKKKDKQRSSEEKKTVGSPENQNSEKFGPDIKPSEGIQDSRILVELGKRAGDDGETGSQTVQKFTFPEQRKANLPRKAEDSSGSIPAEAYDNIKDQREYVRISNGQSIKVEPRGSENGMVGSLSGQNQNKFEGGSYQVEKVENKKERKEKNPHESRGGTGNGQKNEDRDKNSKAEDKKRKKEKKKEKKKNRNQEPVGQRETSLNVPDVVNNEPANILKESHDFQGSPSKRKKPEMNGFVPANGTRPGTMSRSASFSRQVSQNSSGFNSFELNLAVEKGEVTTNHRVNGNLSSSHPAFKNNRNVEPGETANNVTAGNESATTNNHVVSNGLIPSQTMGIVRKVEPSQTTSNVAKMEQGVINSCKFGVKVPPAHPKAENGRRVAAPIIDKVGNRKESRSSHKVDNKGLEMNGILDGKSSTSFKPSSASVKAMKVDTSVKPPHPDLKYLSQILTIPVVEWPEFDNQEWLFGSKYSQAKRAKVASSQNESTKQVWAQAIHMESADITALPYVIPY